MTDIFFNFFTTGAGWIFAGIGVAIINATTLLINQYFKVPGSLLAFWSRLCTIALITPFMFMVEWPSEPMFYVAVIGTAFGACYGDIRAYNVMAHYGGGAVSRLLPLIMFMVFPLWFLFDLELLAKYIDQPLKSLGIIASLIACGYFTYNLKKCPVSEGALKMLLPALICYALNSLFGKYAMQFGDYEGAVLCYIFIQSIFVFSIISIKFVSDSLRGKETFKFIARREVAGVAVVISVLWIAAMVFQNTARITVPNPAYLFVIGQLSTVLISIFYLVIKHKEEGDVASGFGIVVCAIVLSLLVI